MPNLIPDPFSAVLHSPGGNGSTLFLRGMPNDLERLHLTLPHPAAERISIRSSRLLMTRSMDDYRWVMAKKTITPSDQPTSDGQLALWDADKLDPVAFECDGRLRRCFRPPPLFRI